jgi:iron complex outermembrane receptor protein
MGQTATIAGTLASALLLVAGVSARADEVAPDLSAQSLEQLADLQVTSVSKRAEAVVDAPSSIYVITRDAIARSGRTSLPEILRLAPNLQVSQAGSSRYVITARGLNGSPEAQNFSNKLLVMIDGRTVYTPLFSGVYWDMQGVVPQDLERVEVISGPGATLWGANAVNGVINITTRSSADTQGGLLVAGYGDRRRSATLRYGGRLSEALTWRVYATSFQADDSYAVAGGRNNDHWSVPQAGFRADWAPAAADLVTLQGDLYEGFEAQRGAPAQTVRGGNVTSRWTRTFGSGAVVQAQAYYDRTERGDEVDGSGFKVDTYDVDLQHSFTTGRHSLVWGGGYRQVRYRIDGAPQIFFEPAARRLSLANAFVQDTVAISDDLSLVAGVKLEDDPYVRPVLLPNVRLSWRPAEQVTLWAAASRAVRAPTPFDRDVVEVLGGQRFLVAGGAFRSERLNAYELGLKAQPTARTLLSVAGFYNDYDRLRSIEPTPVTVLPLRWDNRMAGHTYGVEAWGSLQVTEGWRLGVAANYLDGKFRFTQGASALLGPRQAGNDPKYQARLTSTVDLGPAVTLHAALRYVSAMPEPRLPAYTEFNARVGWALSDRLELSLAGANLLHRRHREYVDGAEIPRSVYAELQWRF